MRLHHLCVSAFGPFAETVDLDLDQVAGQGLFLIRGATGAGKTSLLDAVSFALYADVPGARSKKGLHSDHAAPGTVPQVTLELTASGRRLRVERSPEFRRPKSRGSGEITVPAKAALFELVDGSWQALSTRHDEIADVIQDVLGLGLQQFSKVVMLPQGDFAAFLRASPEERRELLERLFDVSAFVNLEDWFAQRRKESAAALDLHRAGLRADLGVLAEVLANVPAGVALTWPDWADLSPEALPTALQGVAGALEEAAAGSLATVDAARLADVAATAAHAAAVRLDELRQRGAAAQARHEALLLARPDHDDALATVDAASRAASVHGDLRALDRSTAQRDAARGDVASARQAAGRLGLDDRTADGLELVLDRLVAGTGVLEGASARQAAIAERTRRRDEAEHRRDELVDRVAELSRGLDQVAEHDLEIAERCARADAAAAGLATSERGLADLERLRRLRSEQDRETAQEHTAATLLARARGEAQDLRDLYQDARQSRLDGMAAELAAGLQDGAPCPVCGASEHPDLAAQTSSPVTAEAVDAAESAWRAAEETVTTHTRAVAALRAAMDERAIHLGDDTRSESELAQALRAARADHEALSRLAATQPGLQSQVAHAAERREVLATELAQVRDAQTAAAAARDTLQRDLEAEWAGLGLVLAEHADCPCAAPAGERLDVLRRRHESARATVESLVAALRQQDALSAEHEALRDEVQAAIGQAGFASIDAARVAYLADDEVADLRQTTRRWEQALLAAQATLDDPEVAAALEAPEPDVNVQVTSREAARTQLLQASSDDALLRRTADGLSRVRTTIVGRCSELATATGEHVVVREVADTLGGAGSNALRMRLSAFVLAARLEKVVALANERLVAMGDGRYQLRHTDGLAARGARSGLGLEVMDLWTGHSRDTSSLSGGESFMASLALALGLADAVREEAGGFDLQTLFIDEGFGTLDDESLEQVMEVLDGLREGGRAVGVVSHVAELRSRIPSQVIVSKSERGSTVRMAGADGAVPAA